jgi:ATP-dependent Clp protease ATP-binding subunit ClpA
MDLSLPIYVEVYRPPGEAEKVYRCRPLFFLDGELAGEDRLLQQATTKLVRSLRRHLEILGRQTWQDNLAAFAFSPAVKVQRLKLALDLRERIAKCSFHFVVFESLGRRLAFTPSVPELWFEIGRQESLQDRAREVLARHFLEVGKRERDWERAERLSFIGEAWVTTLDLSISTRPETRAQQERRWAALWDEQKIDGAGELRRVGRCLDWLYPDELHRAMFREAEVAELERCLASPNKRPVLLVGPRRVGKTAVLHELVYRRVAARKRPHVERRNVWLLSPGRLISGMSYVGQWENRLLAILKTAHKREHVLYFDDVLGLYQAGQSAQSSLCVADVLKTHVQRREVRIVAEMTPEALHAFQERDRGFADQFQVLPVAEPGEDHVLRMLLETVRRLESQHRCSFHLEALPTVIGIVRRYVRDAAFPGKAADVLARLAVKCQRQAVEKHAVYREFHAQTGLALSLLDHRQKLPREEILAGLRQRMIGQDQAVHAAADVISIAKARLNDPGRPLATLLFLGPTGVGKTQCAKSIAAYLFSDESKLLRFDMNEYVSPQAAARLVGTRAEPEGLLTGAVRRQPFAVVLLDEIEKAHPDVFDLLLQAIGEGRLTDSLGRTTDFGNTIIVMTSNLGTREAATRVGFDQAAGHSAGPGDRADAGAAVFVRAAERFFRPEFFNRIDRVVPFTRLERDEVRQIAELLIGDVLRREGLVRRRTILQVLPGAMDKVVDEGYHPELGARALKRAIERQITQPAAARLAAMRPNVPTVVTLYPQAAGVGVLLQELEEASASAVAACSEATPDEIASAAFLALQYHYYAVREQAEKVRRLADELDEELRLARDQLAPPPFAPPPAPRNFKAIRRGGIESRLLAEICACDDIHAYLREITARARPYGQRMQGRLAELRHEAALLEALFHADATVPGVLVLLRAIVADDGTRRDVHLAGRYLCLFRDVLGMPCRADQAVLDFVAGRSAAMAAPGGAPPVWLAVHGPDAWPLIRAELGTHLVCPDKERLVPVQVKGIPFAADESEESQTERLLADLRHQELQWLAASGSTDAAASAVAASPYRFDPVVRVYESDGVTVDLRSGLSLPSFPSPQELRTLMLAGLPVPEEFASG